MNYFSFCRSNPCLPDFIPPHFYPHNHIEEGASRRTALSAAAPVHPYRQILEEFMGTLPNPDDLRDMLGQVMRLLAEQGLADKELVLTEWNSTTYQGIDE
ncbi:hypothetical protein ABTW76_29825 [Paenibacillus dendritiformis]